MNDTAQLVFRNDPLGRRDFLSTDAIDAINETLVNFFIAQFNWTSSLKTTRTTTTVFDKFTAFLALNQWVTPLLAYFSRFYLSSFLPSSI